MPRLACLFAPVVLAHSACAENAFTNGSLPGILIRSERRAEPPTSLFVAEVDLENPRLHLRVARGGADPDGPGPWQTTLMPPTQIAARERFDFVINGDFFKARNVQDGEGTLAGYRPGQWALVVGPAETDGQTWAICKEARPCLVIHKNRSVTIETLARPGPDDWDVIAGNVWLVKNGRVVPQLNRLRHPRTAVGLDASGHTLTILVVDGRKPGVAVGMSYEELASEFARLGCAQAFNLDGGGSSVMAVRLAGNDVMKRLNEPTDGHERAVANVLGISVGSP